MVAVNQKGCNSRLLSLSRRDRLVPRGHLSRRHQARARNWPAEARIAVGPAWLRRSKGRGNGPQRHSAPRPACDHQIGRGRPDLARRLTVVREPRRLPALLSVQEVTLLLQAAPGPKYKAAFATAYGAGLRVSEVAAVKGVTWPWR
jgi:integrase